MANRKNNKQEANPVLEWLSDNLRYFELAIILIAVIVVIVVAFRALRGRGGTPSSSAASSQSSTSTAATPTATPTPTEAVKSSSSGSAAADFKLVQQTSGAESDAVKAYFEALEEAGVDERIASYNDFDTYVVPGPTTDTAVAFVRYTYQYTEFNDQIPALLELFIKKDADGTASVQTDITDAQAAYMQQAAASSAAKTMIQEVKKANDDVLAANPELSEYMAKQ